MESRSPTDNELFKNSVSYLHNISSLDFNPPSLKCLFLTKARIIELRKNIQVPSVTRSATVRCQRCFLNLNDGPATYNIEAEEKNSKFARRVLAKSIQDKPLTKYQRKYIKRMNKFSGNKLVIACKFCKKESRVNLNKAKDIIHPDREKKVSVKKKKKIKKKDKFCGLKRDAVLSLTPDAKSSFSTSSFIPLETSGKKKIKKKDEFCSLKRAAVLSLTPDAKSSFSTSSFIPLETSGKKQKFSVNKKQIVKKNSKGTASKVGKKDSQTKVKQKSKLKEFLSTSGANESSPSGKLKHFLQGL